AAGFIDVVNVAFAGCCVLAVAYAIFSPRCEHHLFRLKMREVPGDTYKKVLHLRVPPYADIVLFVERIDALTIAVRLHASNLNVPDFQQLLIHEIRTEYQHTITQQLYVSDRAWAVTEQLKERTIALIRNAAAGLPAGAGAKELSTVILSHITQLEDDPYRAAVKAIKSELPE